jgi:hypothetical protein
MTARRMLISRLQRLRIPRRRSERLHRRHRISQHSGPGVEVPSRRLHQKDHQMRTFTQFLGFCYMQGRF